MTKLKETRPKAMFNIKGMLTDRAGMLAACPWIAKIPSPHKKVEVGYYPGHQKDYPTKHACDGIKYGHLPLYATYKNNKEGKGDEEYDAMMKAKRDAALEKARCKKNAGYIYVYQDGRIAKYCMDHVYSSAIQQGDNTVETQRFVEWAMAFVGKAN
ncbi:gp056 [Rhodococcus phage ReqiDocB7]|uniref:gp056 n=1 Tax=Rhodococcus phage ReqiDocB7 TaxID=691966 RepID=UPI0001CDD851|nr:gp056 [Rhodococcus phage ReqiDocB7]ADD80842.1 gp056 [Rhodococcus phage ReqiDocB7]